MSTMKYDPKPYIRYYYTRVLNDNSKNRKLCKSACWYVNLVLLFDSTTSVVQINYIYYTYFIIFCIYNFCHLQHTIHIYNVIITAVHLHEPEKERERIFFFDEYRIHRHFNANTSTYVVDARFTHTQKHLILPQIWLNSHSFLIYHMNGALRFINPTRFQTKPNQTDSINVWCRKCNRFSYYGHLITLVLMCMCASALWADNNQSDRLLYSIFLLLLFIIIISLVVFFFFDWISFAKSIMANGMSVMASHIIP